MDDYAIVSADATTVTVYTAKSQSMKAMGRRKFQKSKADVLALIEKLIGVDPGSLMEKKDAA